MRNSNLFALFTIFLLLVSNAVSSIINRKLPELKLATGPNCHMCEVMLNNVRYEYLNDFTNVSVDQLRASLYIQCDANFNGFTDEECQQFADQDSADILKQLQQGKSSYRICQQESFC